MYKSEGGGELIYDRIFVHAAQMGKVGANYEFLPGDKHGFLHGEIRIEAIKVLRKKGRVKEIIVVGGPTEDGTSKAKLMAERIGGEVIQLESRVSTWSNIKVIKNYLGDAKGINGLLTNFYHLPRAMRLATEEGVKLIPICVEAVLLADDPGWLEKIKEWYGQPLMLTRIVSEIQGISQLEEERYENYRSEYG